MDNETFEYIHDAMCWVLDVLDDLSNPDFDKQYQKLDKAIGKFYTWYHNDETVTGKIKKLGKLNVSSTNMTMNQNTVDTVINTLNQVIGAVNKHADIIQQIGDWGTRKGECLWCEKLTSVNLVE